MNKRRFGKTNKIVSEIGLGTWQLGSKWGEEFNYEEAFNILEESYKNGINFIDTADIYLGGKSETTIGEFIKDHPNIYVTTKIGRALNPHIASMYTKEAIIKFVNDCRIRQQRDTLDLVLLHCPPTDVYMNQEVWDTLNDLKQNGIIKDYGVSIEKIEEGIIALKHDITAIEVVFNMFRLKPIEKLFIEAKKKDVAIIARVPLASGLLTGKYDEKTTFSLKDHRNYNRNGERFDKGETFSGVPYEEGLKAVSELNKLFNTDNLSLIALRWILMFEEVSVVIPGASKASHIKENVKASDLKPLTSLEMIRVEEIYNEYIKKHVHDLW